MRALAAFVALALALCCAWPVRATLSAADLAAVSLNPKEGASIPTDLPVIDDDGRLTTLGAVTHGKPSLLILADYNCHTLCGPVLLIAAAAIRHSGLVVGKDFNLVVVGIDARDTAAGALRMKRAEFGDDLPLIGAHFVRADTQSINRLAAAISYRFFYDADSRQFAHPTDLLVLTPIGRVSTLLPGLALTRAELRFALVAAGSGTIASWLDRIEVICCGFDPAYGVYDAFVRQSLIAAAAATIASIGAIAALSQIRRRRILAESAHGGS
jgi:protein SCO1/2